MEPATLVVEELAERLRRWNDAYEDEKLLVAGRADDAWLAEGKELLTSVRQQSPETHSLIVTEP